MSRMHPVHDGLLKLPTDVRTLLWLQHHASTAKGLQTRHQSQHTGAAQIGEPRSRLRIFKHAKGNAELPIRYLAPGSLDAESLRCVGGRPVRRYEDLGGTSTLDSISQRTTSSAAERLRRIVARDGSTYAQGDNFKVRVARTGSKGMMDEVRQRSVQDCMDQTISLANTQATSEWPAAIHALPLDSDDVSTSGTLTESDPSADQQRRFEEYRELRAQKQRAIERERARNASRWQAQQYHARGGMPAERQLIRHIYALSGFDQETSEQAEFSTPANHSPNPAMESETSAVAQETTEQQAPSPEVHEAPEQQTLDLESHQSPQQHIPDSNPPPNVRRMLLTTRTQRELEKGPGYWRDYKRLSLGDEIDNHLHAFDGMKTGRRSGFRKVRVDNAEDAVEWKPFIGRGRRAWLQEQEDKVVDLSELLSGVDETLKAWGGPQSQARSPTGPAGMQHQQTRGLVTESEAKAQAREQRSGEEQEIDCGKTQDETGPELKKQEGKAGKSVEELDRELMQKMAGHAGDGGEAGVEYENGQPVAMKRGVKNNMFRYI